MKESQRTNAFEGRDNPFEDTIVREPWETPPSATGLNDKALDALVRVFDGVEAAAQKNRPLRTPKAKLVVAPRRGYGKTHLLSRLFQKLERRASLVYLTPFQDPIKPWQSILRMTIDEMIRPLGDEICQLGSLATAVLARLAADHLAEGGVKDYPDVDSAVRYLRSLSRDSNVRPTIDVRWVDWLTQHDTLSNLIARLRSTQLSLDNRERAWLLTLAVIAKEPRHSETWSAAVKWIRGEALELDELGRLTLTAADNEANGDVSPWDVNDLCYRRMRALCELALLHRPLVFCFDQTEFYIDDRLLIRAFGRCVWQLVDVFHNHMTIVTTNQLNWQQDFCPNIEPAHLDRFSNEFITLEGAEIQVAADVLRRRLNSGGFDETSVATFFAGAWLDKQFDLTPEIGVRELLNLADRRFRDLAKLPPAPSVTLDTLFDAELAKIRANPSLQTFNPDALLWFVKDIGPALAGVSAERLTNSKYFSALWRWADRRLVFAFEGADHHRRWESIAKETAELAKREGAAFAAIALRTPDLPAIPRPTWKATGAAIEQAKAQGFRIVDIDAGRFCEILAARELHSNALQGNIDFEGAQTLVWLKARLASVLEDFVKIAFAAKPAPTPAAPMTPVGGELEADHERAALAIVREQKIVDISVVLALIGGEPRREALLKLCVRHPNLKAHAGPTTTMLQWRL